MPATDQRTHEVTFCSRVSKWADSIFENNPAFSFRRTEIEESKGIKRKRSDLRVYGANNKVILAGEVKLPETAEGRNAYNSALVDDSYQKASNIGAEFFFTWNVNKLVLFDSKLWHLPITERRVKDYDLGLELGHPDDVSRAEVEKHIQKFLADFFTDLQSILEGKQPDWGMPPDEFFIRAFESHISWPVKLTAEFLWAKSAAEKQFDGLLQEWMSGDQGWIVIRNDAQVWRMLTAPRARSATSFPTCGLGRLSSRPMEWRAGKPAEPAVWKDCTDARPMLEVEALQEPRCRAGFPIRFSNLLARTIFQSPGRTAG